jgi:predicted NUDIX family NTP pyrophosphohydrolase
MWTARGPGQDHFDALRGRPIFAAMKESCGLLMYVRRRTGIAVLLVHPGGPYWRNKDEAAWSIPKGLPEPGEAPLDAALREFREETNLEPKPPFRALTPAKQKSGKLIRCWAFEGKEELSGFKSGTFEMEWPPKSGRTASFPEADRAEFMALPEARRRIVPGQAPILDELEAMLARE